MNLYKHQKQFLEENPDKTSLVWSCGTGKTRTALEWAGVENPMPLVICPKALKTNWWRESQKYGVTIHIVSKEEFRKLHKELRGYKQVIVDEVHNGFLTPQFKSQMSKALKAYLKKHEVPRVLLLSATVYTSSPWNIFNLAYFTGNTWNWAKFKLMFFDDIWMGRRQIPVVKKGSEKKLAELTKEIASIVNIEDCLDIPLQLHTDPEYFSMSKEQEKIIKDNYDPVPIVRFTMQHEVENGILVGNEFREAQSFICDKNSRIWDLVNENPKIAIVCRYNAQIDALVRLLKTRKPMVIRGDVKDRDAVCLSAEKADSAIIIIQADCGIGFELPSFPVCVYASMSYSYTSWEQMNGRFLRMNKPSRTTFIYLLTENKSIDQAIYDCIKRKEDFKIELYDKKRS